MLYSLSSNNHRFTIKDGIVTIVLIWVSLTVYFMIPWVLSSTNLDCIDAWFESTSGLTTTGAEVIKDLSVLSKPMLLYHQLLQWIGGIGIIIFGTALVGILNFSGVSLAHADSSGDLQSKKIQPRFASSAKSFFFIYAFFTVVCAVLYMVSGLTVLRRFVNH